MNKPKLTPKVVSSIRLDKSLGATYPELERRYGVGKLTLIKVVHHRRPYES